MKVYFDIGTLSIPAYGLMIAIGVVFANIVAMFVLHKTKLDFDDFILLEAYCFLGAFLGAKILYLLVSVKIINWKQIFEIEYFNQIMQGGFVFYGGLIGGLLFVLLAGRIHKIAVEEYIRNFIFLIPFIHAFGRIGCFCAGCCFGVPYNGIGAVVFPEHSYALPNVRLFPVQLVEATILIGIAVLIIWLQIGNNWKYTIETYLLLYGIARFLLEYFRYDADRGSFGMFTTSQWISFIMITIAIVMVRNDKKQQRLDM